jgi:hypothetical protein
MSFGQSITIEATKVAHNSAEFAFRHPTFIGFAIDNNAIAKGAYRRLEQEEPKNPNIPQILRHLINAEKRINQVLRMAVVSDMN